MTCSHGSDEIMVIPSLTLRTGAPGAATTSRQGIVELATTAEVRAGADTERAVTPAALAALLPQTGDIKFTSGSTPPAGWLACDGSILAADTPHSALRTFLGSRFALPTDPNDTVRLPDARRAALIGSGGAASAVIGNTVGSRGGKETHTLTIAEMPAHTHTYQSPGRTGDGGDNPAAYDDAPTRATTGSTGGGAAHNNMPPSLVALVLIKT